jgi:hypothetical protein
MFLLPSLHQCHLFPHNLQSVGGTLWHLCFAFSDPAAAPLLLQASLIFIVVAMVATNFFVHFFFVAKPLCRGAAIHEALYATPAEPKVTAFTLLIG